MTLPKGMAALLSVLAVQAGTFIWSYAQLTKRMETVERWIDDNKAVLSRLDRLEVQNEFIRSAVTRIENKISDR